MRRSRRVFAAAAAVTALACGALLLTRGNPARPPSPAAHFVPARSLPAGEVVDRGVRYLAAGPRDVLDAYLPRRATGRPWVLELHGGSWAAGDKSPRIDATSAHAIDTLTHAGFVVFAADYPLSGDGGGLPWDAQRQAVLRALGFVRAHAARFGIAPDRGALYGYSAGGNLAASVAATTGTSLVRALVTVSGVLEPRHVTDAILAQWEAVEVRCADVTWPYCATRWRDFTPLTHVRRGDPPALLFAGDNDAGVPYGGSERFAAALRLVGTPARVILGHGTGHLDTSWYGNDRNTTALLQFLRSSTDPSATR